MRRGTWGAAAGSVLVAVLLLTGCGGRDSGSSDAGTSGAPSPSASTAPPPAPAPAGERLVTVTVSGGIDGRHQSMLVNGDGSYTMLSLKKPEKPGKPEQPERKGQMKPAELAELRTALAEADFAKLPRLNIREQPIPDGLTTAVAYRGHEVVTDGSKPVPGLDRVIAALPPMSAGA